MRLSNSVIAPLPLLLPTAVHAESDHEDLSGVWSVNSKGHPFNEVIELEFLAGEIVQSLKFHLTGLINPTDVGTGGGSWASDAEVHVFSTDGKVDFVWHPWADSAFDHPGTTTVAEKTFTASSGLPWTVPVGGADLIIEFYESYDDDEGEVDGILTTGSYLEVVFDSHPDTDHDGMPDTWEDTHDLIVGEKDGDADPDKDGVSNLLEYAFGSDPHVFSSGIKPLIFVQENALEMTYIRRKAEVDVLYIPEVSTDLKTWAAGSIAFEEVQVISRDSITEWVTVKVKAPVDSRAKAFVRLKVQHVP